MTSTESDNAVVIRDYDKKKFSPQLFAFDCGDDNINHFLIDAARHTCTTKLIFVHDKLAAFVSYNCSSFERIVDIDCGEAIKENEPAIEIKVYAVDKEFQHNNYMVEIDGKQEKFSHFIFNVFMMHLQKIAHNVIAASHFIVFSKKERSSFLEQLGFRTLTSEMHAHVNRFERDCTPMFATIPHL